jgi:uncharacterized protein with PQ loop repeat
MTRMYQHQHAQASPPPGPSARKDLLDRVLPLLSVFTMAMTVPQVWAVWVQHETAGVSLLSWGAYSVAALLWMVHGMRRGDPTIWVACIGWVLLDGAVVLGLVWPSWR